MVLLFYLNTFIFGSFEHDLWIVWEMVLKKDVAFMTTKLDHWLFSPSLFGDWIWQYNVVSCLNVPSFTQVLCAGLWPSCELSSSPGCWHLVPDGLDLDLCSPRASTASFISFSLSFLVVPCLSPCVCLFLSHMCEWCAWVLPLVCLCNLCPFQVFMMRTTRKLCCSIPVFWLRLDIAWHPSWPYSSYSTCL